MAWICLKKVRLVMSKDVIDKKKLNLIKIKVIKTERDNIIKKDPEDTIVEHLRKSIERTVDGK